MLDNLNSTVAYRINFADNTVKQADDAYDMPIENGVNAYDTHEHCTYLADFSNAKFVEGYLNSRGVNFVKIPESVALNEESVIKRTVLPADYQNDGKHSLALLNTDKFEKYYKNDIFYLPYEQTDRQCVSVLNYLKSGEDFEAPQVDIYETDDGLSASFNDGRHRYAILRELGFKYIPMCLDENSLELAKKYGLIKNK